MGAVAPHYTSKLFTQPLIKAEFKEKIKAPSHWPLGGPHEWPVTRKMFQFDDVIMINFIGLPRLTTGVLKSLDISSTVWGKPPCPLYNLYYLLY